jgi:hypothetical protein
VRLGNSKLGKKIHQWSIPAGIGDICIGATKKCLMLCYALRSHYRRKNVQRCLDRNYKLSLTNRFVSFVLSYLVLFAVAIVRIHAAGDFYSPGYVRKWIRIAKSRPDVVFYAYTRSWRREDGKDNSAMIAALAELAALPNMRLWLSCDCDTGPAVEIPNTNRCYLQEDNLDLPNYKVDLFFRNKRTTVVKKVNGTLVCPVENGTTTTTCSACKLCFKPDMLHRINNKVVTQKPDLASCDGAKPVRTRRKFYMKKDKKNYERIRTRSKESQEELFQEGKQQSQSSAYLSSR